MCDFLIGWYSAEARSPPTLWIDESWFPWPSGPWHYVFSSINLKYIILKLIVSLWVPYHVPQTSSPCPLTSSLHPCNSSSKLKTNKQAPPLPTTKQSTENIPLWKLSECTLQNITLSRHLYLQFAMSLLQDPWLLWHHQYCIFIRTLFH